MDVPPYWETLKEKENEIPRVAILGKSWYACRGLQLLISVVVDNR
jgi:hypothetical protein